MQTVELERLGREFFARDTRRVARELLGTVIVRKLGREILVARVVETEAYRGDEPACHAYANMQRVARGELPRGRSAVLFGEPGTAYVYFNYGMHWLFNVVTEPTGKAGAVLFRAIEPVCGVERMRSSRPRAKTDEDLGNGPGKLSLAMGIGREFHGCSNRANASWRAATAQSRARTSSLQAASASARPRIFRGVSICAITPAFRNRSVSMGKGFRAASIPALGFLPGAGSTCARPV